MLIEMTIKGLMVDPITNMPIIILRDKDGQRVLPISVGVFEANAIALKIENVPTPLRIPHSVAKNAIEELRGRIDKIVVSDLKENTFYALIYLTVAGEMMAIDARPSDAIALALRARRYSSRKRSSTTQRPLIWCPKKGTMSGCRSGWSRSIPRHGQI
jgi:bifunctional DNase/RNase